MTLTGAFWRIAVAGVSRTRHGEQRELAYATRVRIWAILAVMALSVVGCGGGLDDAAGVTAPDGFRVQVWASGFDGPTQMTWTEDGDLVIAELNGAENDATGRVLLVDRDNRSDRVVLQDGLNKPTGVAVTGNRLWIMEQRRLSVTTLEAGAPREVVADELPFNGRSEGTLTVLPDGTLLYNTSGSKRGAERTAGSGTLFAIADAATATGDATVVATGFKHAYAHLMDPEGQLWVVEMTDGTFDDQRASDELVAIAPGDDAGWPFCVDNNRPVDEFGGTADGCTAVPASHALFGPGATPTSLVIAPWDDSLFVVALWLPGEVVSVPRSPAAEPHEPLVFLDGIESPQHLLVDGETLLVSDHETGQILVVSAP